MAAVVSDLAAKDQTIARPYLTGYRKDKERTVAEFLHVHRQGGKQKIRDKFKDTLAVCATANGSNLDKMIAILGSPLRLEVTRYTESGIGLETFSTNSGYEMVITQCFFLWNKHLSNINDFITLVMGDIPKRHYDSELNEQLASMEPRNLASLQSLFWPGKGQECPITPVVGGKRSYYILRYVSDEEYVKIYQRLCGDGCMDFKLLTKKKSNRIQQIQHLSYSIGRASRA